MRLLEIRLFFDSLFHYFSQLQAVDFIGEGSSCNEKVGGEAAGNDISFGWSLQLNKYFLQTYSCANAR